MVCEYFMTRRAGRKKFSGNQPASQKNASPINLHSPETASNWATGPVFSAENSRQSPGISSVPYPDLFLGASSVTDHTGLISTALDSNVSFDEFLTSPISISTPDLPNLGNLTDVYQIDLNDNICDLIDIGRTATSQAANTAPLVPMRSAAIPELQLPFPFMREDDRPTLVDGLKSSPTHKFIGALGLLTQATSPSSSSLRAFNGQNLGNHDQQNTVQSIIIGNEQAIQALDQMLELESSEDKYFLAILSVVTLKVLASYAAVVRQMPTLDSNDEYGDTADREKPQYLEDAATHALVDNYFTDNEDLCRKTAQQIFRQLHRVQRLVNRLSKRFKTDDESTGSSDFASPVSTSSTTAVDSIDALLIAKCIETMFPFPSPLLKQLQVDLRERLRKLSAEIVDILR
ncbi:Aflatoxin regulatory protein [Penicillium occitanis (nom. inval.)]|nr:Aflatoxin regulatory protein [Penicillium occitanis (nom. inval.)]PCG98202.1 hypothetical protein PENOC_064530 [Penicillium occitanis (nom. inval.)]